MRVLKAKILDWHSLNETKMANERACKMEKGRHEKKRETKKELLLFRRNTFFRLPRNHPITCRVYKWNRIAHFIPKGVMIFSHGTCHPACVLRNVGFVRSARPSVTRQQRARNHKKNSHNPNYLALTTRSGTFERSPRRALDAFRRLAARSFSPGEHPLPRGHQARAAVSATTRPSGRL